MRAQTKMQHTLLIADCGDYIVVTNARQIVVTGKKAEQKVYRSHTMYPGGLKEIPYARMMERKPDQVRAISCVHPLFG